MIKLLIKLFIKDYKNTFDTKVREKYSYLSGITGIICNLILFFIKIIIGAVSGSIAIISDAFNNFSDMGTSVVSIIGTRLSNAHADKEHPFGHGRIEYISSLIVSFLIMLVGFELLKSSVEKIITPSKINLSPALMVILILSVLIKVWMFLYNRFIAKEINSKVIKAVSQDSINDVIATTAIIISTVTGKYLPFSVDGFVGAVVSILIMYSGFNIAKDTVNTLLGASPDEKTVKSIEDIITENKDIIGIHDLIVHDYGPGRVMASVHAEVACNSDIVKIHEIIDQIENYIETKLGIHIVIHVDPINASDEIKDLINNLICEIDNNLSFHDLRIYDKENTTDIVFDLCIPVSYKDYQRDNILYEIKRGLKTKDERYNAIIRVDNKF